MANENTGGASLPVGNGSFVNLLGNDMWSDEDISNRTEAMVRSEFSLKEETIINRDITGTAFGVPLSPEQAARVMQLKTLLLKAREDGTKANADMALLRATLPVEASMRVLDEAPVEPVLSEDQSEVLNQAELDEDATRRDAATAVVASASADAAMLAEIRLGKRLYDGTLIEVATPATN